MLKTAKIPQVFPQREMAMDGKYRPGMETLWNDCTMRFEKIEKMGAIKSVVPRDQAQTAVDDVRATSRSC